VLIDQLAGKRVVLLCHSRGGILARRYLRRNADASEWIGRVITLCSPHQGTEAPRALQRLADVAAVLGAGQTLGASLAVDLWLRITGLLGSGDGHNQLLPDDPLFDPLLDRLADPADVPDIEFTTFGGTSVRYGRIYSWHYTPASFLPRPPDLLFDWTQVPFEERLVSPLLDAIPESVVEDEQDEGEGDGLVANHRSFLPGAPHRSVAVNHAEALWDENLFAEVADLLGTPLSGAGPVDCGRPEITHTLTIQPAIVSFGSVNIGTTATRPLRIRNTTGNTVTVQLAASPPGVFEWAALNATLPAGEEASVQFRFRPVDHAIRRETVRFTSTAPGSPHTIGLIGKGPGGFDPDAEEPLPTRLSFRPRGLSFGSVSVGDQATRVLTIGNNTGSGLNVSIAAGDVGVFRWPALTATMGPNTERQLTVTFRPTDHDLEHGTLTVLSNTAASPDTIKLFGKGPGGFPIPEEEDPEEPLPF
jgi:pimeloyl-ACP methyl ester carboxylesterase